MILWICDGCGIEHGDTPEPPAACVLTVDPVPVEQRGHLPPHGRAWITHAVVRRLVDALEPWAFDRLYTLGGDEITRDAHDVVRRCAELHIRHTSGEFDHLT